MPAVPTALELLGARTTSSSGASLLSFHGVSGHDVYNLTAPFRVGETPYLAARVEPRDSERSTVRFFTEDGSGRWAVVDDVNPSDLQDPFTFSVAGRRYVGGVRIETEPGTGRITGWSTVLLEGQVPDRLQAVFEGPAGMKDLRFVDLGDRVGVLTRPQGEIGGRGTIGYAVVDRMELLRSAELDQAPLLDGQFAPGEWGGANEAHDLGDGRIGVLGHVAYFDDRGDRHYYAMAFVLDAAGGRPGPLRVVATRADFPSGPAKRTDLRDVIFPGGLIRHADGTATLYAGLSDAQAGQATIPDPFTDV